MNSNACGEELGMKTARSVSFSFVVSTLLVLVLASSAWAQTVYTKYNIHAQTGRDIKASYANWTDPGDGHTIFQPNTRITICKWRRGFCFTVRDGRKVYFEFDKGRMKMSAQEYIKLITSPKPVSMQGLTDKDREGVRQGIAMAGMTKKGVMTALGYPATHRTPTLEDNKWTYWRNRFRTLVVHFDDKGIVTNVQY